MALSGKTTVDPDSDFEEGEWRPPGSGIERWAYFDSDLFPPLPTGASCPPVSVKLPRRYDDHMELEPRRDILLHPGLAER